MKERIYQNIKDILKMNSSDRVWQLPFFAALGVGLVLAIGSYYDQVRLGLVAMIGVMSVLYIPNTPIYHKMAVVMCCSFGITLSFFLGILTHFIPTIFLCIAIGIVAMLSSILVRYYDLGAPGYFFFVFACLLGAFYPFNPHDIIFRVGLVCMGTIVANFMAFFYSISVVYVFKNSLPQEVPPRGHLGFDVIVVDSMIIGFFVGFSILLGNFLELERSYWVTMSCTIIMQGITLNSIWIKQLQRIIGTALGVLCAWWLLGIRFNAFEFVIVMMILFFLAEFFVTRNYALAMVFITPYATYLTEAGNFMSMNVVDDIIIARLTDVAIGSVLGLIGGFVMYKPYLRIYFERFAKYVFRIHPKN